MRTDDLIAALAADETRARGPGAFLALGLALGIATFAVLLAPRDDLEALLQPRGLAKLAVTLALLLAALPEVLRAARPGQGRIRRVLAWPLALLAGAVLAELATSPTPGAAILGHHPLACLGLVPLIGLGPLAALLALVRQGAPTAPRRAGALAGLAAGGIAASLYALHCTDDSPLFVAAWYGLAVAGLTGLGAALGPRLLRW